MANQPDKILHVDLDLLVQQADVLGDVGDELEEEDNDLLEGVRNMLGDIYAALVANQNVLLTRKAVGECKFCGLDGPGFSPEDFHYHDGGWVCPNCWDERLRETE
jgi:hypothetical protein